MSGKNRVDNVEHLQRVRLVQQKMIEGYNSKDIINSIVKLWGIGERQAKNYIAAAYKDFKEFTAEDTDDRLAFHRAARLDLLKWASGNGKKQFQLKILQDLAKLDTLYIERTDVTSKGESIAPAKTDLSRLSKEELKIMAEIHKKIHGK